MKEYILKDTICRCGSNKIVVIATIEKDADSLLYGKEIVSHGACIECCENSALPIEPYNAFILENCKAI